MFNSLVFNIYTHFLCSRLNQTSMNKERDNRRRFSLLSNCPATKTEYSLLPQSWWIWDTMISLSLVPHTTYRCSFALQTWKMKFSFEILSYTFMYHHSLLGKNIKSSFRFSLNPITRSKCHIFWMTLLTFFILLH